MNQEMIIRKTGHNVIYCCYCGERINEDEFCTIKQDASSLETKIFHMECKDLK